MVLLLLWVGLSWGAAEILDPLAVAFTVMLGFLTFWALLPKAEVARPVPRWTILPLLVAFIAGLFLAGYMAALDRDLTAVAYGVWFALWLQLGLWLRARSDARAHDGRELVPPPNSPSQLDRVGEASPPMKSPASDRSNVRRAMPAFALIGLAMLALAFIAAHRDENGGPGAQGPTHPAGTYPPAPSTAGEMSPEWEAFAQEVDRICATNFNRALAVVAAVNETADEERWSADRAASTVHGVWASSQAATYRMVGELGAPPARAGLLSRWRENVGMRGELFARMGEATAAGDHRRASEMFRHIRALKRKADPMGQRFGLRICTSN